MESKDFEGIVGVLDSNESLVMKYRRQGEERVYSLVNARTGTLIHPITLPEKTLGGLKIFAEDKRWLFLSESKDILWIQDSATGEIRYTRHREGHVFFSLKGTDAEGQLWALSRDQNNRAGGFGGRMRIPNRACCWMQPSIPILLEWRGLACITGTFLSITLL